VLGLEVRRGYARGAGAWEAVRRRGRLSSISWVVAGCVVGLGSEREGRGSCGVPLPPSVRAFSSAVASFATTLLIKVCAFVNTPALSA
jgi:hypothetical protein